MLGSHNSLSYLLIKGWMKILKPWTACQSLNVEEQWNKGVRYFDIRLRKDNEGNWCYCHNRALFTYMEPDDDIIEFLIKKKAYIRIMLDVRSKPKKNAEEYKDEFFELCNYLIAKGMQIDSIIVNYEWKEQYNRKIQQDEYHSSVSAPWYKYILGTKWFAKNHNKDKVNSEYLKDDDKVLMLDFIEEL